MLDANKIYSWTIIVVLLLLVPCIQYIKFLDELCAMILIGTALLDSMLNNAWGKYKLLWIVAGILSLYAIYSIFFLSNNTAPYILMDLITELKPFAPFAILLSAGVKFSALEKSIIKKICIVNSLIISVILILSAIYFGASIIKVTVWHITYCGNIIFISCLFYIFCDIDNSGEISKKTLYTVLLFLTIGLLCGRSKYFAVYVCAIPFILYYKPGFTKHLSTKSIAALSVIGVLILVVSWSKFNYYFMGGGDGMEKFDPRQLASFARPVLYMTGYLILFDYFPFGSGLASFATYPSQANYSNVYFEYGINNVWGLSPAMPEFICDAYYPSLAQVGIVGLILFIWFWIYAYSFTRTLIRNFKPEYKYKIIINSLCIIFILVESTTGTTFTYSTGLLVMSLLGISSYPGYKQKEHNRDKQLSNKSELQLIEYKI